MSNGRSFTLAIRFQDNESMPYGRDFRVDKPYVKGVNMRKILNGICLLCMVICFSACTAAPAVQDVAAPEFPWENGYEATVAALKGQGVDFTADPGADGYQPSVRMDSGTLFGVDASELILWFNKDGTLTSVNAYVALAGRETLQANMEAAMGAPAESCRPAMRDAAMGSYRIAVPQQSVLNENYLAWHSARPLAEAWSEEQQAEWKASVKEPLVEQGVDFTSDTYQASGSWGALDGYVGDAALDAFLQNSWGKNCRADPGRYTLPSQAQPRLHPLALTQLQNPLFARRTGGGAVGLLTGK